MKWHLGLTLISILWGASAPIETSLSALTDQNGKPVVPKEWKDDYVFLSFVFTRCPMPAMCPLTTKKNKQLLTEWEKIPDAQRKNKTLRFIFVTLDPKFDTPERLRAYAKREKLNPPAFSLLTGTSAAISAFGAQFNVVGLSEENSVAHNVRSVLLSPDFHFERNFDENAWSPSDVLATILK